MAFRHKIETRQDKMALYSLLFFVLCLSSANYAIAADIKIVNKCPGTVKVAFAYSSTKNSGCDYQDPLTTPPTCMKYWQDIKSNSSKKLLTTDNNCVWLTAYLSTDETVRWGDGETFDSKHVACTLGAPDCYAWTSVGGTTGACAPLGSDYSWSLECPNLPPAKAPAPAPKTKTPAPAPTPSAVLVAPPTATPTTVPAPSPDEVGAQTATTGTGGSSSTTGTTNTTTNGSTTTTDSSDSSTNVGAIVGGVVGGVALVAAGAFGFMAYKKRKAAKDADGDFEKGTASGAGGSWKQTNSRKSSKSMKTAKPVALNTNGSFTTGNGGGGNAALIAGGAAAVGAAGAGVYAMRQTTYTHNKSGSFTTGGGDGKATTMTTLPGPETPGSPRVNAWAPGGASPYGRYSFQQSSTPNSATAGAGSSSSGGGASIGHQRSSSGFRMDSFSAGTPFNPANDSLLNYLSNPLYKEAASKAAAAEAVAFKDMPSGSGYGKYNAQQQQQQLDDAWAFDWDELEILRCIGEGGFGKVYAARWKETMVAVKVLLRTADDPEEALTMSNPVVNNLRKEAILLSTLRHPNIVIFMGICPAPPAIATEYCARGSLMRILNKGRQNPALGAELTWTRRLNIALDAAKGMLYLHAHNPPIIHRDLKSPNLLVDEHWRAKVTDFNLSRIITNDFYASKSLDATNPRWLAPEVLKGASATAANDVYAFGIVLWELMAWDLPWGPIQSWSVVASVTSGGRPEIPDRANLPGPDSGSWGLLDDYIALMNQCWAQEAERRPNFQQIVVELRRLLEQTGGLSPSDIFTPGNVPEGFGTPKSPRSPAARSASSSQVRSYTVKPAESPSPPQKKPSRFGSKKK